MSFFLMLLTLHPPHILQRKSWVKLGRGCESEQRTLTEGHSSAFLGPAGPASPLSPLDTPSLATIKFDPGAGAILRVGNLRCIYCTDPLDLLCSHGVHLQGEEDGPGE